MKLSLARDGAGPRLIDPFASRPKWQTWTAFIALVLCFVGVAVASRDSIRFQGWGGIASLFLAASLLILSWIDLDRFLLPDFITIPQTVLGVVVSYKLEQSVWLSLAGAIIGYLLIAGIGWAWRAKFGRDGVGLGDAKLLAGGGAWLGALNLPFILLVASGLGLIVALLLRSINSLHADFVMPFGPLLSLGIWAAWCVQFLFI